MANTCVTREALHLALTMSEDDAAYILTVAEEPELLFAPGEPLPYFTPAEIAAARILNDWAAADYAEPVFH